MRTRGRGLWITVAGLLVAGVLGCQTITDVDRSLILDGGGGGQGSDAGQDGGTSSSGQGGGSDAGGQ